MSSFEITSLLNNEICIEIECLECESTFSTDLDFHPSGDNDSYYNNENLYCRECNTEYECTVNFENNKLQVTFKEHVKGTLRECEKVYIDDYKTSSPMKSKRFYHQQIERLERILEVPTESYIIEQSLNRLVFTGVITALETYLNEVFILIVFNSQRTLSEFVRNYEPYKKEKFNLSDILLKYENLHTKIRNDLDNLIYHNIKKIIPIFNIFQFELDKYDKIKLLIKYIQMRHNFVHRSGLDENDNFKKITKKEIISAIKNINSFVDYIDNKIENKCYAPEDLFDLDIPF